MIAETHFINENNLTPENIIIILQDLRLLARDITDYETLKQMKKEIRKYISVLRAMGLEESQICTTI
jgi:hypothetical protein